MRKICCSPLLYENIIDLWYHVRCTMWFDTNIWWTDFCKLVNLPPFFFFRTFKIYFLINFQVCIINYNYYHGVPWTFRTYSSRNSKCALWPTSFFQFPWPETTVLLFLGIWYFVLRFHDEGYFNWHNILQAHPCCFILKDLLLKDLIPPCVGIYHVIFIHSSVDRHFGCFHVLTRVYRK